MIKTMGVQPFIFDDQSPYLFLLSISDVINYFDLDIITDREHVFLDREDCDLNAPFDGSLREKQYFVNGILITGLFELLSNESFAQIEDRFETFIDTLKSIIQRRLVSEAISSTHEVFVHDDEDNGDVVIGFRAISKV